MAIRAGSAALRRETLLSVLEEAAGDRSEDSIAARALCSACEFWAAVSKGTLRQHLGAKMAERLRYAALVYQAMGAIRVANTIHEALAELACTPIAIQRQQLVGMLQERLLGSTDPLQDLIVRLAHRVH